MGTATLCPLSLVDFTVYVSLSGENRVARLVLDPDRRGASARWFVRSVSGRPGADGVRSGRALRCTLAGGATMHASAPWQIEPDGTLTPRGRAIETPSGACYVSTDRTGRFLLSAYYADGVVAVHGIGEDGVVVGRTAMPAPPRRHRCAHPGDRPNQPLGFLLHHRQSRG